MLKPMNAPLVASGCLTIAAAGIHGVAGELLVVRRLSVEQLPATRFGGSKMTRAMIHASWHLATLTFVTVAAALLLSGAIVHGEAAHALALLAAVAITGCALLVVVLGGVALSPRAFFRHPAPALLTVVVALAWWGAL